jgi:hypothetical protein
LTRTTTAGPAGIGAGHPQQTTHKARLTVDSFKKNGAASVTAERPEIGDAASVTRGRSNLEESTPVTRKAWAETEARRRTIHNAQYAKEVSERDPTLGALLRSMITRVTAGDVIAEESARRGEWCGQCAGDLGENVYRTRRGPTCAACQPYPEVYRPIGVCSCGRNVYALRRRRGSTRIFCCEGHRVDQVNAAHRRLRALLRRRRCGQCGEEFTPPRSDARYCSPACRQKAYRTRKTTS